jgi:hypothetical protein
MIDTAINKRPYLEFWRVRATEDLFLRKTEITSHHITLFDEYFDFIHEHTFDITVKQVVYELRQQFWSGNPKGRDTRKT